MMDKPFLSEVIEKLRMVLPHGKEIALHEPCFSGNEWNYIRQCLDTGWVSSVGQYVKSFEEQLAEYIGVKYAVALVNGTAALHLSLILAGVGPGDEVLVPALSFVATANAVAYCGATPHFVDSEEVTLGMDPCKLEIYLNDIARADSGSCINRLTGRPIKAVIPVHTFGHPADLDPLAEVCSIFHLELIEDATESLGSRYKGRPTGSRGRMAVLSFNGNKIVTTGGGGAILTNDEALAHKARHLSTQAKLPHPWLFNHDATGYNYRMPNINAALGCAQLEQLNKFIDKKRALAARYQEALAGMNGIRVFREAGFVRSNYWLNVLMLNEKHSGNRDALLELTNREGIMTRPAWTLMHRLPMYCNCPCMDLSIAESLESRIINLPSSVGLQGVE